MDCIACDDCSVWYHKSCVDLATADFEHLQRSTVAWICPKCDSINCNSFTFRSFSLESSNYYWPLQNLSGSIPSPASGRRFSPLKANSPRDSRESSRPDTTTSTSNNHTSESPVAQAPTPHSPTYQTGPAPNPSKAPTASNKQAPLPTDGSQDTTKDSSIFNLPTKTNYYYFY
jgi:hypothetical protein